MNQRRPSSSIASRLAVFEKNIARNAELAAQKQKHRPAVGRRNSICLTTLPSQRRRDPITKPRHASDNDSVQTATTTSTNGSIRSTSPRRHNKQDLVSLNELEPICGKQQQQQQQHNDSFNSSLSSTMDFVSQEETEERVASLDSILQSSASRLLSRSTSFQPVPSAPSRPRQRRQSCFGSSSTSTSGENLQSLVLLLNKLDAKPK